MVFDCIMFSTCIRIFVGIDVIFFGHYLFSLSKFYLFIIVIVSIVFAITILTDCFFN